MPDDDSSAKTNENAEAAKKFIVDGIFPRNLVHLVAAPVATGKTTMFMQQIHAMQNGLDFLTKRAFESRIVYITADRGKQETDATLVRLGLTGLVINLLSLKDMRGTIPYLENMIEQNCKRGDLVIIEPLNFFLRDSNNKPGDINNFGQVSNFLLRLGRIAEDMQITIEGSLHSSKAKQGAQYMVAREKVIGSVAWTAFSATTVVLEPADPTVCDDPGRLIHVLPRDIRPFTLEYTVEPKHGLLIQKPPFVPFKSHLDLRLESLEEGETFTRADADEWSISEGKSPETSKKWLAQMTKDQRIIRVEKGVYKRVRPS